jgi:hypothetical protein
MSDPQFERAVSAWLEDGSDRTPRSAIDGVLLAVKTTPQERDLRIPWRFPLMPAFPRATGIAAVALVAVIGAGALVYLTGNRPGFGSQPSSAPTVAPSPTLPPGITGWKDYTSAVYGFTMRYPSTWSVHEPAAVAWEPGMTHSSETNWTDIITNDESVDGDSIAMWVWQFPAPEGADLDSWDGLRAAYLEVCASGALTGATSCDVVSEPLRLCRGTQECQPAIIQVLGTTEPSPDGFFGDSQAGTITVFSMGRPDSFEASARYGGTIALLKAILGQVDVREPRPGETPQ